MKSLWSDRNGKNDINLEWQVTGAAYEHVSGPYPRAYFKPQRPATTNPLQSIWRPYGARLWNIIPKEATVSKTLCPIGFLLAPRGYP